MQLDYSQVKDCVTLFRGQTLPRSVLENLTKSPEIGLFPTNLPASVPVLAIAAGRSKSRKVRPGIKMRPKSFESGPDVESRGICSYVGE